MSTNACCLTSIRLDQPYDEILEMNYKSKWHGFYIEYKRLRERLPTIFPQRNDAVALETTPQASTANAEEFMRRLDFEISRTATCYRNELNDIKQEVEAIRAEWSFLSPDTFPRMYENVKAVVENLRDTLIFMELNVQAVHLLLLEASQMADRRNFDHRQLLRDRLKPDSLTDAFAELRIHKGTKQLIDELKKRLDALRFIESSWLSKGLITTEFCATVHTRRNTECVINDLYQVARKTALRTRWYYALLAEAEIDYEAQPVGEGTTMGLFLNNFNTFLYMANYYLVIPTAFEYAMAVGLPANISGYLLAMTPFASLFASVLYSLWSNVEFKMPLLFCTVVLVAGNLLYALAFDYHAPWMLFVGRLCVGIGGNRAVNRRYIADFVSMDRRTLQSAIFVTAGSLGMSLGPGMQPLVNQLPTFSIPYLGWTCNSLTAPPLVMVIAWIGFVIVTMVCFEEPRRFLPHARSNLLEPLLVQRQHGTTALGTGDPPTYSEMNAFHVSITSDLQSSRRQSQIPKGFNAKRRFMDASGAYVCLLVYFVLKFVQEAFQTASPLVAADRLGWTDSKVGLFLAIIGLVVLPSNILIGWLGNQIPDRWGQLAAFIGVGAACVATMDFWGVLTHTRYIGGAFGLFIAAQALESINMSLLSKLMPKSLSKGLWNSGFLSTEAGTIGRVVGAALISILGELVPDSAVQNWMDVVCLGLVGLSIIVCMYQWRSLIPLAERRALGGPDGIEARDVMIESLQSLSPALRPLCISTRAAGGIAGSVVSLTNSRTTGFSKRNYFPPAQQFCYAQHSGKKGRSLSSVERPEDPNTKSWRADQAMPLAGYRVDRAGCGQPSRLTDIKPINETPWDILLEDNPAIRATTPHNTQDHMPRSWLASDREGWSSTPGSEIDLLNNEAQGSGQMVHRNKR